MVANSQLQFADPFGLNRIAQPAEQQAQMAQAIKDDQFKALLGTYEPNQYKGLGAMYGTPPQLQTQVEARTVGEGIMKGVGLGLGNLGQQIQYGRRQKAFEDMAAQQQQAQNSQRALIQAQIQAEQDRQMGVQRLLPEAVQPIYGTASPEQRALIEKANADARTKSAYAKDIGAAAGTEEIGKKDVILSRAQQVAGPLEQNGVPQPAAINAYNFYTGQQPTTTQDIAKAELGNVGADLGNQKAKMELGVLPQKLADDQAKAKLDIEKQQYDNLISKVNSDFAETEKRLKIKQDQLGLKDSATGKALFQQLQESGDLYNKDPGKQAEIQAQLGVYGIKWNPPDSGYTTIKGKDGKIWLMDKMSGRVGKLEKDGRVKTWQDIDE